jgi:hypothetical protein
MNILLQSKAAVEKYFGKKAILATNVLGMVNQGEKAFGFSLGGVGVGYSITVGFFNDKARYVGFKKRAPGKFDEGDLRAVLSLFGPFSNWSSKPGSEYVDYVEKTDGNIIAEAAGWFTAKRGVAFVYITHVDGEIAIVPERGAVDAKLVNS